MLHKTFLISLGLLAAATASQASVVMQVNGAGVTDYALNRAKRGAAVGLKGHQADPATTLRRAVDQVIGHVLLVQAARAAGVVVSAEETERRIAALRGRYPSPEAFAAALQEGGTTEAELRLLEQEDLQIQRYTETVLGPRATVEKDEAAAYYREHPTEFDHLEQVKVQMILVAVAEGAAVEAVDAARAKAAHAAKRLAAGEPFATVAQEVSDDPTRSRGGEVGWVQQGQLLPELDAEVLKLQAGQVTAPLRTGYGFHIMGALERRPAGRSSLEEVEANLLGMLKANKVRALLAREVQARRATAVVETLDPAIKSVLAP